jgi:hypothetical protein
MILNPLYYIKDFVHIYKGQTNNLIFNRNHRSKSMGWKIPTKFKQRNSAALSNHNRHSGHHSKNKYKDEQNNDELLYRSEVIKLTYHEAIKYKPCPRHGKKYLVKESGAIYCFAETKGEMFERCFYHVAFKDDEELCNEGESG